MPLLFVPAESKQPRGYVYLLNAVLVCFFTAVIVVAFETINRKVRIMLDD